MRNKTQKALIAYVVRAAFVDHNGVSGARIRTFFNLETQPNGVEIFPGEVRLLTLSDTLRIGLGDPSAKHQGSQGGGSWTNNVATTLRGQQSVLVSLDLVVFNDGEVVGPDESNSLSYLKLWLRAQRDVALAVQSRASVAGLESAQMQAFLQNAVHGTGSPSSSAPHEYVMLYSEHAERMLDYLRHGALAQEITRVLAKPGFPFSR